VLPVGKIKGEENMKVYPDNNVLVDIEAGKYSAEMFLSISDVVYYYSDAHMNELLEAKGNPKVSQKGRLGLISKLCGCNNILTGVCDVLVTNDKRMRAKTKAVYSFLGVKTRVVSTNEYLGI